MAMPVPFTKGKSALLKFLLNNAKVEIFSKTWEVGPDVTKINDGVNGEDRDRLDVEVNFYNVSFQLWLPDAKILKSMFDNQANNDAGVQPFEAAVGCVLKPQDGSKFGFALKEMTVDDWKLASSGRTDRIMFTLPMRARYCDQVVL